MIGQINAKMSQMRLEYAATYVAALRAHKEGFPPCSSKTLAARKINNIAAARHCSVITRGYVPIPNPVSRNSGSPLPGASEPPPREYRATPTTRRAEASASEAPNGLARQALLGCRPSVLGRVEKIADRRYTGDCSPVAPGRFPLILAANLQGQDAGRKKIDIDGSSGIDLQEGRRESDLESTPDPWGTPHARF